jgi:hypothetical protein
MAIIELAVEVREVGAQVTAPTLLAGESRCGDHASERVGIAGQPRQAVGIPDDARIRPKGHSRLI